MKAHYAQLPSATVFVSELSFVESSSAITRVLKSGFLTQDQAAALVIGAHQELASLVQLPVSLALIQRSAFLARQYSLRALDAIQLASGVEARTLAGDPFMQFISSDMFLLSCASAEHFDVWDPCA